MKTLMCTRPGRFEFADAPMPELKLGNAIIKIKRIGVCGTDIHAFEGTQPFFNYPRILGHELAGELIDFLDAPGFEKGEAVTFIPYFNCGICMACRSAKPNCCTQLKVCGVHVDGGMGEYISVPTSSLVHTHTLSFDEIALVEPLAIGAHGIKRANVKQGEFVLIIGAGPIGLAAIEFAKIAGAKIIVIDVNEYRLQFCKDNLKIDQTINAINDNVIERLKEITNNDMPSVVIDATGNLKAINEAFQYISHGGRFVLIGLQKGNISFSHPEFHKREGTLMSSRNATREDFEHVISCVKSRQINALKYITHRVIFDNVKENFESLFAKENNVIKAMIEMV